MTAASVEQWWPSSEWWLDHDIAQDTGYVKEIDRRIDAARKRLEDAHFALVLARAPEEITGQRHTDEEIRAAATAEHFAHCEVDDLAYRREGLVDEIDRLKREQAAQQRAHRAATIVHRHVPVIRARTQSGRPRERHERRTRRSSSSSSGDDSSGLDSSDPDPPGLAGLPVVPVRGASR